MQREAYTAATSSWKDPAKLIHVPHKHASPGEGSSIPLSYRYPSHKAGSGPVAVILCISGLDGFRTDFPGPCTNYFNSQSWANVGAEISGCGDCPAAKMDPESLDRLWSSVLDWIAEQPELDEHNVCAWGFSTGGYYSLRAAHTHAL
jgi:dienelactone hydrolase